MRHAGMPIIILNSVVGGYALYGMAGLRNNASSIVLHGVINLVQSGASMQLLVACVYLSKSLVSAYRVCFSTHCCRADIVCGTCRALVG